MWRIFSLLALACFVLPVSAHDWYSDKKTKNGGSCCSGDQNTGDCESVARAWVGEDGMWRMIRKGKEYVVPEWAIHPDNENPEPFTASACVYHGQVICFWRKATGG